MDNEIGIRQLKNEASAVIERVERGEVITVTRRGKPVARVIPADMSPGLAKMILEGRLIWSGRKPKLPSGRVKLKGEGPTAAEIVIEDRGPR